MNAKNPDKCGKTELIGAMLFTDGYLRYILPIIVNLFHVSKSARRETVLKYFIYAVMLPTTQIMDL